MAKCSDTTKIFISALILMQMSADDSFPPIRRCNALRMINLDAPQMALQGDTIELSCSYSLITPTSSSSPTSSSLSQQLQPSPSSLTPQDNHGVAGNFFGSKPATSASKTNSDSKLRPDSSVDDKLPNLSASGRLLSGTSEPGRKRTRATPASSRAEANSGEKQVELVYAIKWYKDEREFFRYLAQDWPHKQAFPLDGLNIDVDKSDNQTVVLKDVSLKTSGLFKCEVSTEAPTFLTKSIARKLFIYSLPNDGPTIEQPLKSTNQVRYLGDQLNFACSSRESKPATQIDWIINETLNLSSFAVPAAAPAKANGTPLFLIKTRRVVRLPTVNSFQRHHRASVQTAHLQYQSKEFGSQDLSSMGTDAGPNLVSSASLQQKSPLSFTAYELDDSSWPPAARPLDSANSVGPISLGADSLHQLLETTISWLNFSVDSDLLQYLSSVGPLSEWPTTNAMWSTRKSTASAPSSNVYLAPPNLSATSQENSFSKTRRKDTVAVVRLAAGNTSGVSQKRSSSQQQQSGATFLLRVRCVARVMHLSMSDDIKLKIVNKTKGTARQEQLARANAQGRKNSSGEAMGHRCKPEK